MGIVDKPRDVVQRGNVGHLLRSNLPEALRIARSVEDPWYRCQSLAAVAGATQDPRERRELVEESFRAAEQQSEPNRVVTVSAWPMEVLARDLPAEEIEARIERLADRLSAEPHAVRRCDALFMVAYQLRDGALRPFVYAAKRFAQEAREGHGWKRDRNLRDLAVLLWDRGERALAEALRDEIEEGKLRRQAAREMGGPA